MDQLVKDRPKVPDDTPEAALDYIINYIGTVFRPLDGNEND